jgi:hypothetical protein
MALAYKFQISIAGKDLLRILAAAERESGIRPTSNLSPGTRLVREWAGRTHYVEVTDSGLSYEGRTYRSLSALAREITGVNRSGPLFFGLKAKRR